MDQRFIELPFTSSSGTLFVQMTDKVTEMPPGYYLMFAFNQAGVPSQAKIVRVNIPANPVIELDYTAVVGGSGAHRSRSPATRTRRWWASTATRPGRTSTASVCAASRSTRVGLDRQPCQPRRGRHGDRAAFTKTCARDFAISGYRGPRLAVR
jgi:hypothetical protein